MAIHKCIISNTYLKSSLLIPDTKVRMAFFYRTLVSDISEKINRLNMIITFEPQIIRIYSQIITIDLKIKNDYP